MALENLTASASGGPKVVLNSNGKTNYEIEISDISMSDKHISADLQGGDISTLLDSFMDVFVAYVQTYLMTKFDTAMRESLEDTINDNIINVKTSSEFDV